MERALSSDAVNSSGREQGITRNTRITTNKRKWFPKRGNESFFFSADSVLRLWKEARSTSKSEGGKHKTGGYATHSRERVRERNQPIDPSANTDSRCTVYSLALTLGCSLRHQVVCLTPTVQSENVANFIPSTKESVLKSSYQFSSSSDLLLDFLFGIRFRIYREN